MADAKDAAAAKTGKETEKMLTLVANDGEEFLVEESVAIQSQTIKNMVEDGCGNNAIPIPNVSSRILALIIEFCRKHAKARAVEAKDGEASSSEPKKSSADDLKAFDANFVMVDQATLFDLILAANYLDINVLLDLTCQAVADMMKGKSPEEIRKTFNIVNDFTPEEEAELKRENQWAFD